MQHEKHFFEKLYTKFGGDTIQNQNWAYLWINSLKFYTVVFIVCQVEDDQNILKLSCRPLAFISCKVF